MHQETFKFSGTLISKLVLERRRLIEIASKSDDPANNCAEALDKIGQIQYWIDQLRIVQNDESANK